MSRKRIYQIIEKSEGHDKLSDLIGAVQRQ